MTIRQYGQKLWTIEHVLPEQGGLRLDMAPPYQRGLVWGVERKRKLIQSLLEGLPIGAVVVNDRAGAGFCDPDYDEARDGRWVIVDGKQRITALREFLQDQYAIPTAWLPEQWLKEGHEGETAFFGDLKAIAHNAIKNMPLTWVSAELATLGQERELFDRVNFGGLAQGDSDDGPQGSASKF